MSSAGRVCPLSYRFGASKLRAMPRLQCETIYAVGGLYGNMLALRAVQRRVAQEERPSTTHVVFNGDFNFFNASPAGWHEVNNTIREGDRLHATLGNVEVEATGESSEAGCGCAYPEYVSDGVVERSNTIVHSLRAAALGDASLAEWVRSRPMGLVVELGDERRCVGIVHGDPDSLAGWGLAVEVQQPLDAPLRQQLGCADVPTPHATIRAWCKAAGVQALLSTHTCLPFFQDVPPSDVDGPAGTPAAPNALRPVLCNNGSAGMPNFAGLRFGLATRVSADPRCPRDSLYGLWHGGLRYDAIPVRYEEQTWLEQFEAAWPAGSAAHMSYHDRIVHGPRFSPQQAARGTVELYV